MLIERLPYALVMLSSLVIGYLLLRRSQSRLSLPREEKWALAFAALVGATIGSRIPFWLMYEAQGLRSIMWFADGKTIMCGIVGGYVMVEFAKWILRIRLKTGDTYVLPAAVAIGIGRIGCFIGGCCFGVPTSLPWGVSFKSAGDDVITFRHPTQLYEAAFHFTMAIVFFWVEKRGWLTNQRLKAYLLAYLGYRFLSEFIRPETKLWLDWTAYQWAAIGLAPVLILLWYLDSRSLTNRHGSALPSMDRREDGNLHSPNSPDDRP